MKSLLALFLIVSVVTSPLAHAADPPSDGVTKCDKIGDYKEMVACFQRDSAQANAKVTQAYELLMKRLGSSDAAEMLSRSQKAWIEYQSTYCAFVRSANEGGSIVQLTGAQCSAGIAKSRLNELEAQTNCQEGTFGCYREH